MILYFSGTGNSRYVAERIKEATNDEVLSINKRIKTGDHSSISSQKPLVFVLPTYAWRIPRVAGRHILNTTFQGNQKTYFIMTCGDEIGNAAHYLKKLCKEKGFDFYGAAQIIMPENYIALFDVPAKPEADLIIKAADPSIQSAIAKIMTEQPFDPRSISFQDNMKSHVVNPFFYPFVVSANKFYSTDACIHCGKCVRLCPLNNVILDHQTPKWGKNCTHCMACICGCPTEAIEYGKASHGKPRYYLENK